MRVGFAAEFRRGAGEQLGLRIDLGMDFHADDHFPVAGRALDQLGFACRCVHRGSVTRFRRARQVPRRAAREPCHNRSIGRGNLAAGVEAERLEAAQDRRQRAVPAALLRAHVRLRIAIVRTHHAGRDDALLAERAGAGRQLSWPWPTPPTVTRLHPPAMPLSGTRRCAC